MISNDLFNTSTGKAIVCPITRTDKGYPFHILVEEVNGPSPELGTRNLDPRVRGDDEEPGTWNLELGT